MKIAIDFDGTLVKRSGIPTQSDVWKDPPQEGAIDAIQYFKHKNIEVYILTNRDRKEFDEIAIWLISQGLSSKDVPLITNQKQKDTKIYIDDRAYRFTNWNDIRKLLE